MPGFSICWLWTLVFPTYVEVPFLGADAVHSGLDKKALIALTPVPPVSRRGEAAGLLLAAAVGILLSKLPWHLEVEEFLAEFPSLEQFEVPVRMLWAIFGTTQDLWL